LLDIDLHRDELPGPELHRYLAARRREGAVVPATFFGGKALLVTRHDAVAEAFRDDVRFPPHEAYRLSIEPLIGRNFQSMAEPEHLLYRRLATPAFRSRAVERHEQTGIGELARELVASFASEREVDLAAVFTHRFPFLVISRLLGIPRDAEASFHRWALEMLAFRSDPDRGRRARDEFTRYLEPVIAAHRREPGEGILPELIAAEADGRRLTDEEIHNHARLLFAVGATTTHDALGSLLFALLTVPGAWRRVREDPAVRPWAVEESLRWETAVAILPRLSADATVELAGTAIPPRSWVLFGIAAANRDPEVFRDPDRYDLDRRPTAALTFGPGPRSCPGMHLARREMLAALDVLVERFPDLTLVDVEAAQPRGATVRGPARLPVRLRG
jgi:cytochrome P450